jgi:hypothetical protein
MNKIIITNTALSPYLGSDLNRVEPVGLDRVDLAPDRTSWASLRLYHYPFVWQKRLFVLGALGAPAWVSMLQAP